MDKLFNIENLRCSYDKNYREGISKVVLEIKHLEIPKGKKIFIVGESGIGKSTILETLGMMTNTLVCDSSTRYDFFGPKGSSISMPSLWRPGNEKALSSFRLQNYSFIFQSTNLMKNFTAYENICFTRMLQGYSKKSCFEKAKLVLEELGLEHVNEKRMAQELSGGQQQRLAFARAILPDFAVLFGDEPTGNLDGENAVKVMQILSNKLDELNNASAIIVSHDMHLAVTFADVIIKIRKEIRPKTRPEDEDIAFGVIDNSCVYFRDFANSDKWSNGETSYLSNDFEVFLRTR